MLGSETVKATTSGSYSYTCKLADNEQKFKVRVTQTTDSGSKIQRDSNEITLHVVENTPAPVPPEPPVPEPPAPAPAPGPVTPPPAPAPEPEPEPEPEPAPEPGPDAPEPAPEITDQALKKEEAK